MEKYIYQIKNKINGKSYIGQTNNYHRRFLEHKNFGYDNEEETKILYSAFKKYGIDNFDFIILEKTINYNEREKFWIKEFHTYINDDNCNGYNMTEGGEEPPVLKGEKSFFCTHSKQEVDEIKNHLKNSSISIKDLAEKYAYEEGSIRRINSGKIWYDENLSYPIRVENTNSFKLERAKNIVEDLKYSSLTQKEIGEKYNVSRTTITAINRGQNFSQLNNYYPIREDNSLEKRKKPVKQYDLNNNFIKEFESVSIAAKELKVSTTACISSCARGEIKTAYGFIWRY